MMDDFVMVSMCRSGENSLQVQGTMRTREDLAYMIRALEIIGPVTFTDANEGVLSGSDEPVAVPQSLRERV